MATWKDILKQKGQTDEQIKAIETAVGTSGALFDQIMSDAQAANDRAATVLAEAQQKEKTVNEFWEKTATPKINEAYSAQTKAEAEAAFYRTQAEEAKKVGFLPANAPGYVAPVVNPNPNNPNPTFQPGTSGSPTAPQYMTQAEAYNALIGVAELMSEHQALFNEPLRNFGELTQEAQKTGSKAKDVWAKKYNVEGKRQEIAAAAQKAHDDKIVEETRQKVTKEMADRYGSETTRPMRPSLASQYVPKDATGRPDKLAWADPKRKDNFREQIHQQVAKEQTSRVQ